MDGWREEMTSLVNRCLQMFCLFIGAFGADMLPFPGARVCL